LGGGKTKAKRKIRFGGGRPLVYDIGVREEGHRVLKVSRRGGVYRLLVRKGKK
jgi:hypothetical protein